MDPYVMSKKSTGGRKQTKEVPVSLFDEKKVFVNYLYPILKMKAEELSLCFK